METTGDDRLGDVTESAPFVRRHIGPDESESKAMLEVLGFASVEELIDAAAPAVIRHPREFDLEPPLDEPGAYARLAALAGRNRLMTSLIGMGYHGTHTPAVIRRNVLENPAWYTAYTPYQSEVEPGPDGGPAQLPADDHRPHRHGARQRVAPRRGDGGGRGDGDGAPRRKGQVEPVPGRRRLPPPDHRRGPHPRGPARPRGGGAAGRRARRAVLRHARPVPGLGRGGPGSRGGGGPGARAGGAGGGRGGPPRPRDAALPRGALGPTSWSGAASASGSPWAAAAPTPRSSPPATRSAAPPPAASSGCRWTNTASPRSAWPSRPGSSISGARRRRATSAPRRSCSPSSRASTRSTTGRRDSRASRAACTAWPSSCAKVSPASASRPGTRPSSTR